MSGPEQSFEEGYIAVGYLLGARGDALLDGLANGYCGTLVDKLGAAGKRERAAVLAAQLLRLTRSLLGQRL
jgi:hypothetical protein